MHQILPSASVADRGYAFGMIAETASVVGPTGVPPVRTNVGRRLDGADRVQMVAGLGLTPVLAARALPNPRGPAGAGTADLLAQVVSQIHGPRDHE